MAAGSGAGQDDAGGAEVDVGGEEAVAAARSGTAAASAPRRRRAVIPPSTMQLTYCAISDAAGQHRALGPRLGAAGVHQPQRVVVGHRDVDLGIVGVLLPGPEIFPPGGAERFVEGDRPLQRRPARQLGQE